MAAVASKNLYELLGNTHDEDSDKEPEPPVKVIDKTPARTDKRSAPREAPTGGPSAPRRGPGGNEGAFRDRQAGSAANRGKPTEDRTAGGRAPGTYEGRGRGRGGRGARGGNFDRHSRGLAADSEKQAGHGWGANEAGAELADEQAGEAIAKSDEKDGGDASADAEKLPEVEAEPEDNSISYSDYLAQQAEKKLSLGSSAPALRKANEGSKEDKKWANAKELAKQEEEAFIEGSGPKAKRERERKAKQVVEIDQRFVEAPERGGRGEGRGRGGRGRGDGARGGRGEFRGRGDGFRGRGEGRGGRGRGDGAPRGAPRGGPRGGAAPINTEDTKAFPSLGS